MSEENKAIGPRLLPISELGDPGMADEIVATNYYNHMLQTQVSVLMR
jgi:hypothetical protein